MIALALCAAAPPLVIGLLLPPEEPEANSLRQGVLLAVDQANATAGRKVSVVIRGRPGPWGADATEAAQLVNENGARGLIAPPDGAASHLVLQVAGRTAVPVVTLCSDSSVTQTGVPWVVRVPPRTIEEARALLAGLARPGGHTLRWTAFVPGGRAGREAARDLVAAAAAEGCPLEKPVEIGAPLFNPATAKKFLDQSKPDAILLWLASNRAAEVARALRKAGFAGTLAGPGRLASEAFIKQAGGAGEDFVVPASAGKVDETVRQPFSAAFVSRYGREPDPTAAMAYDAAVLLLDILKKSGDEPAYRAFPITEPRPGVTGLLSFDRRGNRHVTLRLVTCRGGRWVAGGMKSNLGREARP